jgi:hypothetical protein
MQVAGASVHADRRAMASHSSRPTMGIRTKVGVAVPGTCRGDPDYVLRQGEREAAGKRRFPRSSPRRTVRSSQLGLDPSQPVGARSVNRCLTAPLSTQIRAIYSAAMRAHSAERQGGRGPGVQQRGVPSRSPPRCPVPMARRSLRSGMCMPEERGVPCVGPPIRSVARNGSGMSAGCGSRRTAGSIEAIATARTTPRVSACRQRPALTLALAARCSIQRSLSQCVRSVPPAVCTCSAGVPLRSDHRTAPGRPSP